MNLATLLHRNAASDRDRPALALGTTPWCSYGELARRSAALAGCLRGRFGLAPGERVALAMVNGPAFIEVLRRPARRAGACARSCAARR